MNRSDREEVEKIKTFYDTVYYKDLSATDPVASHHHSLANKLNVSGSTKVLDVACGSGSFLYACQLRGAQVSGVDLSEVAIEACKARLNSGEFHACSAERLPFQSDRFDLVTCLGSLEHFLDPVTALREMVRVAKVDADFVILVPNKDFLTRKLGLYGGTYQVDAREEVRTLEEWNRLFEEAGLSVRKRWKDLHVLSWRWISNGKWHQIPTRGLQAAALPFWPLRWQYQVYHLAKRR